jgi:hypothetical protein
MRLFWSSFLMTGLLLIGVSAFVRTQTPDNRTAPGCVTSEDGTPMPPPDAKPKPKVR